MISIMFIVFKVCYGFSTFIFVVQTISFSHLFLIELLSQFGSDCLTFIILLRMNFSETFFYMLSYIVGVNVYIIIFQ